MTEPRSPVDHPPRLAVISAHTSPLEAPSTGDAGGMNVYLAGVLPELARLGWRIDVLTVSSVDGAGDAQGGASGGAGGGAAGGAGGGAAGGQAGDPSGGAQGGASRTSRATRVDDGRFGDGVRVLGVPISAERAPDKYALAALAGEFVDALEAESASTGEPYAAVHSHYWVSGLVGDEIARRQGIPHVHSMHSAAVTKNRRLADGDRPEPDGRIAAEQRVLSSADAVVVAGASERREVHEGYGVADDVLETIPPGVDAVFRPRDATSTTTADRPTVALVARVQPLKGQLLAVQALALIPADERPVLTIVGDAHPSQAAYASEVSAAVTRLGLADDVVFTGAVSREEAGRILREASVALIPSTAETFGLVALEAAASATPVIARRTSGLVDAVVDGETGVLVDSADPSDWADALLALLRDPERRAELGAAGVARAGGMTWAHTARALDELYRRLIG